MNLTSLSLSLILLLCLGCNAGDAQSLATNPESNTAASPDDALASATLWVKGLSCPLCAHNIDQQLARVPGVRKVVVDLGAGKVTLGVSADRPPTRQQLARAVDASGFTLDRIEMPAEAPPTTEGVAKDAAQ